MKNNTITFRVNDAEKQKLEDMAHERDIPVSQLIREILRKEINNGNSKPTCSNN